MSEAGYLTSKTVRRAVEREFEIIGEALRRLAASHPETFRRITFATQIVSFRNVLAHGYDLVEDQLVWSIAEKRLPALLDEVRTLLAEEEARR
ncbi:MAG: DUF86 domain-containing protein [Candidatus Lambdaproteobacteria bacterium]|nr:DUF86 domain-containing protein [Candidatus Lambdaproteobacteria bacterium]